MQKNDKTNNELYIEFSDFIAAGYKEATIWQANLRNGSYWQMMKNPLDARMPMVKFEALRPNYKEKLNRHFGGDVYAHYALVPLRAMITPNDAAAKFFQEYRYGDDKALPIDAQLKYQKAAELLDMIVKATSIKKYIKQELGIKQVTDFWKTVYRLISIDGIGLPTSYGCLVSKPDSALRKYRPNNFASLIHGNYGNKSALLVTEETEKLLNNLFAEQDYKPTPTQVAAQYLAFKRGEMDMVMNESGELLNPDDYPEISAPTVLHWLNKWENKAPAKAARTGNRQLFINEEIPSHKKIAPLYSGSKLSIDDRQPPFEYAKGSRVWFYMGIDLCSHAWTCWVHGKTKEELLLNFYRQMVRNYTEWGLKLPYELECEMSLNSQYLKTLLADGAMFAKVQCEANNARGKRIERDFGVLRYEYEKNDPGWIPRPFARSESNRAGLKNTGDKPQYIPYPTIIERSLGHIAEWNNSEHPKHKGMSRWEVFMTMQHPNLRPINWKAILPYIGYSTRSSVKAGQLQLQGGEWLLGSNNKVSTGSELLNYLKAVNSKDVLVQWIDGNDGNVLMAHICKTDGRYICDAIRKPAYNTASLEQTPKDKEVISLLSSYVATVTGYINTEKAAYEPVTVIDNTPKFKPSLPFNMPGARMVSDDQETENMGAFDNTDIDPVIPPSSQPTWRNKFLNP